MHLSFEKLIAITLIVLFIACIVWAITTRNKQLRSYLLFGAIPVMLLIFIPVAWKIADDYTREPELASGRGNMGEGRIYSYNYESEKFNPYAGNMPVSVDTITITDPGDLLADNRANSSAVKDRMKKNKKDAEPLKPEEPNPADVAVTDKEEEIKTPVMEMDTTAPISDDKNIWFKRVVTSYRNGIIVAPIKGKWDKMFVICPKTPNGKTKGLMQPDFAGVGYISSIPGEISMNDKKYDIFKISVQGTHASFKTPYYISLQYNPDFLIFGDYNNKNRWYIYKDGRVSYVTQPFGPDKLKLQDIP